MIASLEGEILSKGLDRMILEVHGVGYLVLISAQTLAALPPEKGRVRLRCYTHVREDALQLFGFAAAEEQRAFESLISVSGIGPKLALTILSGMPVADLVQAVAEGNHARLQMIPGIGKKTAERLVLELKDRFGHLAKELPNLVPTVSRMVIDVIEALTNLGYKHAQAEKAVAAVMGDGEGQSAEIILRRALSRMNEP
jgi:Holliday junction DNA helicase RuvA